MSQSSFLISSILTYDDATTLTFGYFRKHHFFEYNIKTDHFIDIISKYIIPNTIRLDVLLLGAGGSGRSTILKQMDKIYNKTISENKLTDSKHYIKQMVLEDIYDLSKVNIILRTKINECKLIDNKFNESTLQTFAKLKKNQIEHISLTKQLSNNILNLWNDPGMQITFNIRKRGHIMDNTHYFFEKIIQIADNNYKPTFDDYVCIL